MRENGDGPGTTSDGVQRAAWFPLPGVRIGHAHDLRARTGCTVVLTPEGAAAGVDVRGSAPGTRETDLLDPVNLVQEVHGVLLAGGSAFGLAAADGVMRYLEERGYGLDVGVGRVPIVPGAVLFDLAVGDGSRRPDAVMGYAACEAAREVPERGRVGAGAGATVGKALGHLRAMDGGLGTAAVQLPGGLVVAAVVAVNAVGHVVDPATGEILAGPLGEDGKPLDTLAVWNTGPGFGVLLPGTNTTIGVVVTNARMSKVQAKKVATMAHDGLARVIRPAHTMYDGDALFALAVGGVTAPVDLVGAWAAETVAAAVLDGVRQSASNGGAGRGD
ncbi:P1 family peptidase [Kyrpidia tusciae]|uniref:Peptidase S58 DmpA n=1 Tax=Kyrpidia tusciae (strain DSM 2912 / NBRC 15312 / T2) TaxID=562970 RepID=D5WWA6_KYRT2|nr:P1 family peptidase [Kyrpidia tusciae]ADG07671.1 peptidase S58 DmpA [Kyrpidia tusciae DSM 2912]